MTKVLVTGNRGVLGQALTRALGSAGYAVVGYDIDTLDITKAAAVTRVLRAEAPDVVVNCAAYTRVDDCESDLDVCFGVNAAGAGIVAQAAEKSRVALIHLSTDYVFDGLSRVPYGEDAEPNPLSAYGRSKWEGEKLVTAAGGRYVIFRTAWLFGAGGQNFVAKILARARRGERLRVVNDQTGSPTYAGHLAAALVRTLPLSLSGVYHIAGSGAATWLDVAVATCELAGIQTPIEAVATESLALPAERPRYSVLGCSRFEKATGFRMPDWREGVGAYLREAEEVL